MQNDFNIELPFQYTYVENRNDDAIGIKILTGEFSGCIFTIDKIRFSEDDSQEDCKMHFDYELQVGEIAEDRKDSFEKAIGDMILYTLVESMKNNTLSEIVGEVSNASS